MTHSIKVSTERISSGEISNQIKVASGVIFLRV